jgi:cold shock CspA family protein
MYCCGQCFGTKFLLEHVKVHSDLKGSCTFCSALNTKLISPSELADLFFPVIELYEPATNGTSLISLLREDWGLCADQSDEWSENLLKLVLAEPESNYTSYVRKIDHGDDAANSWGIFRSELKHSNRYFPKSFPNHKELSSLLSYLSITVKKPSDCLYRARINNKKQLFPLAEMGAPPEKLATAGRANPFGISYLYAASTIETAISELRPHKDETVNVAQFQVMSKLDLVDLRSPKATISPFPHDDKSLRNIHSKLKLLIKLGTELTKPVSKDIAHLEYLSSQYLCEFIKSEGYDGVVYKSSLGDGDNYAIFDSNKLKPLKNDFYKVDDVKVVFQAIENNRGPVATLLDKDVRHTGDVKWYNSDKKFGFIECPELDNDVFFHISAFIPINEHRKLTEGDVVTFYVTKTHKGNEALKVSKV